MSCLQADSLGLTANSLFKHVVAGAYFTIFQNSGPLVYYSTILLSYEPKVEHSRDTEGTLLLPTRHNSGLQMATSVEAVHLLTEFQLRLSRTDFAHHLPVCKISLQFGQYLLLKFAGNIAGNSHSQEQVGIQIGIHVGLHFPSHILANICRCCRLGVVDANRYLLEQSTATRQQGIPF